jgi:hypothetical protein
VTSACVATVPLARVDSIHSQREGRFSLKPEGERLPKEPEGGLLSTTTSHRSELQTRCSSLRVENKFGGKVDTKQINIPQDEKGHSKMEQSKNEYSAETYSSEKQKDKRCKTIQLLGYVPIQIVNLSLEEVELQKQTNVGVASPVKIKEAQII